MVRPAASQQRVRRQRGAARAAREAGGERDRFNFLGEEKAAAQLDPKGPLPPR